MSNKIKLEDFFLHLDNFEHQEIFKGKVYPWEIVSGISSYLKKYFLGLSRNQSSRKILGKVEKGVVLKGDILVAKNAVIESGVYIHGPVIIGEGCQIRSGAYLRGQVILGKGSVVGHGTEIKNSIFLNGVRAAHFNYVGDSILGESVNLGAGSVLANFRFDGGEIKIKGERTQLNKLGAILGDRVQIGCNSVIAPGTLVKKGAWLLPGIYLKSGVYSREDLKKYAKQKLAY